MRTATQILVIGGGPGGSTAATLLAREGFDVTLLEKSPFPRYHIGESLLPSCLHILDLMGIREKVDAYGFQRKHGVHFSWGPEEWDLTFGELTGRNLYSFQVIRSEFDQLLLENARTHGAHVFEGVEVTSLSFHDERPYCADWSGNGETGQISFEYLIDASGRAGLLSNRYLQNRCHNEAFQNVALWGYWKGAKKLDRGPEGAIAVGSIPHGWLWGIPLHDGTLSVGLVIHKTTFKEKKQQFSDLQQIYLTGIQECPLLSELVASGELVTEIAVEQDYSYAASSFAGPGYFIAGDAACFLDPLLSTGIHLASFSALVAAACVSSMLRGDLEAERAAKFYDQTYRQSYTRMMFVVANLYRQYKGKKAYFWEAQKLTTHDYSHADTQSAFLNIVSGIEDVKDVEVRVLENVGQLYEENLKLLQNKGEIASLSEEERQYAIARATTYNLLTTKFLNTPDEVLSGGLYVVTKPRLAVVEVNQAAALHSVQEENIDTR